MTREELVEIMKTNTYRDAADKICAALESEREGEVVLGAVEKGEAVQGQSLHGKGLWLPLKPYYL